MGTFFSYYNLINPIVFPAPTYNKNTLHKHNMLIKSLGIHIPVIHNKSVKKSDTCLVYCHGNATDLSMCGELLTAITDNLYIDTIGFDYQGYGYTQRYNVYPSEHACYQNMKDVMSYVENKKYKKIILLGRSLGTGVVINYAANNNFKGKIILETPYKSICNVVTESSFVYPLDIFMNKEKIQKIKNKILFIHGYNDNIVPIEHSYYLFNIHKKVMKNNNIKYYEPLWIQNAGHNDFINVYGVNNYFNLIGNFIKN